MPLLIHTGTDLQVSVNYKVSDRVTYKVLPEEFQTATLLADTAVTNGAGVIILPYCTSDVYIGNRSFLLTNTTSGFPSDQWHFRGIEVVRAVLQTALGPAGSPITSVLMSGTSAGSIGAAAHVETFNAMYPSAHVSLLLDSWPVMPFGFGTMDAFYETFLEEPHTPGDLEAMKTHLGQYARDWLGGELKGALEKNEARRLDGSAAWPCWEDAVCMLENVIPPDVPVFYLQPQQDLYSVTSYGFSYVAKKIADGDNKYPALAAHEGFAEFFSHFKTNNNRAYAKRKGFVVYAPGCMFHGALRVVEPDCTANPGYCVELPGEVSRGGFTQKDASAQRAGDDSFKVGEEPVAAGEKLLDFGDGHKLRFQYDITNQLNSVLWNDLRVGGTSIPNAVRQWMASDPDAASVRYADTCSGPSCNPTCPEVTHLDMVIRHDDASGTLLVIGLLLVAGTILG